MAAEDHSYMYVYTGGNSTSEDSTLHTLHTDKSDGQSTSPNQCTPIDLVHRYTGLTDACTQARLRVNRSFTQACQRVN